MRIQHQTRSEDETIALGAALALALEPGDVVALHGELGAGKTRFVRGITAGLGGDPDDVASPTFVFIREYPTPRAPLVHADVYRLSGPDDLDSIGWDAAAAPDAIVVIEWAERIADALDQAALAHVRIEHAGDEIRRIHISLPEPWNARTALGALLDLTGAPLPAGWTRCPTTGRAVHESSPAFPFADERSRMADLGKWFSGAYAVSRDIEEDDLTDPDARA